MNLSTALPFRSKLLLAMMLVVVIVTTVTLYVSERNLRASHQQAFEAQFQNQIHAFVALQESRSRAISEKCLALSRSVRLRAALAEGDSDDLYRNALSELQAVLESREDDGNRRGDSPRASFFRFFNAQGAIVPPTEHGAGLNDDPSLDATLAPMGQALQDLDQQDVTFIALSGGHQPGALREVVLTKIADWKGTILGALALGFPLPSGTNAEVNSGAGIKTGTWINHQLYAAGLGTMDRDAVSTRIDRAIREAPAGHLRVALADGVYLLFYNALEAGSQFSPAYQVCLYPLVRSLHEQEVLRWRIVGLGTIVLLAGFGASLFLTQKLSQPVDKIVAISEENLSKRQQAEEDLRETNRQLETALAELKATQQQVIQQERLSAIGQMASGIAHDFNNTLMPILGFADLLLTKDELLSDKAEARKCLELLRTSANDAASVVSRLREFYRPLSADEEFPIVDLVKIITQAVSLTEPKWRHQAQATGVTVTVTTQFKSLPIVAGEESALREVLTNLIFNAVDAMPDGGGIHLETAVLDEKAVIRISDTGTGMTETVRQRCLEPFFSTKGDRGTGLGLSMVYGIIERHRGQLEIESAVGKGTTFIIRLPLAEELPMDAVSAPIEVKAKTSALDVLVVDDEARIREVLSTYMRCDGHSVATAASGREALEKFRRHRFDLVVLDGVMPEMSGEQTARFIKQLNHDTPIIMLTGFGAPTESETGTSVDAILHKPVTLGVLRHAIERLLHAA